jgi:hypothetical protein
MLIQWYNDTYNTIEQQRYNNKTNNSHIMEDLTQKKAVVLEAPSKTLESMRIRGTVYVLNTQRESINGTIRRLKDRTAKRFSCQRVNDEFFIVKRVK